jgi:hypothetical protein
MTIKKVRTYLLCAMFLVLGSCSQMNLHTPSYGLETSTIVQAATRTPTKAPTPTLTLSSTISTSDAYNRMSEFLTNGPKCSLPCWLGITPGKTTMSDALEYLTKFSDIITDKTIALPTDIWSITNWTIQYTKADMTVEIRSAILAPLNENKISANGFSTRAYQIKNGKYFGDVYGYSDYSELLKAYTISSILSTYGIPDQIFIRSNLSTDQLPLPPYSLDTFVIHIWYPDKGIFLEYSMLAGGAGDAYLFCPSKSFISAALLPPNLGKDYQVALLNYGGEYQLFFPPAANVKTSEEALGKSNQEFYEFFHSQTNNCLETPKSIWWPK